MRLSSITRHVWVRICGLKVELRFDPEQPHRLPEIYIDSEFYCDTVELDVVRNSNRLRRRKGSAPQARKARAKTGLDPLRQIQDEHERRSRPPAKGKTPGGPRKTNNDEKE